MDFSFLDSGPNTRPNNRQQQGAGNPGTGAAGTSGGGTTPQQQQGQQRVRIQLPSFRQVQAAEAPTRPVNTFQPGRITSGQQQQQQQQPHAAAATHQAPASQTGAQSAGATAGPHARPAAPPAAAAAGAPPHAAAAGPAAAAPQQPSWAAALPPMSLAAQLPRFSQAASGATTGAAVGISRPTVPLPAAAAAAAGGASSQQVTGQQPQVVGTPAQQQQVPLNAVLVSRRQQGNPVLKHIRAVRWLFADIAPDYLCGTNTAVLFLSLRYHLLQPEYILSRLQSLQRAYRLAVLLLLVDAEEVVKPLQELHRAALGAQATLVCAWSNEECARYIETFKAYENRPASSIMEHTDTDYMGRLASALTSIRGINRSDAYSMARHFGTLADAFKCNDVQGFVSIPGLGPVKAKRLMDTFHQPFRRNLTAVAAAAAPAAAAAAGAQGAGGSTEGSAQRQDDAGGGGSQAAEEDQEAEAELEAAEEAGLGGLDADMMQEDDGDDEGFEEDDGGDVEAGGDAGAEEDEGGMVRYHHQDYLDYGSEDGADGEEF